MKTVNHNKVKLLLEKLSGLEISEPLAIEIALELNELANVRKLTANDVIAKYNEFVKRHGVVKIDSRKLDLSVLPQFK